MTSKFAKKKFRDAWVSTHVKRGLATQLRSLRGQQSQAAFGKKIGKPQSVVARLEDPNYGSMNVQTLLDIASKLDIGVLVKFVRFSRVLNETRGMSVEDLAPLNYEAEQRAAESMTSKLIKSYDLPLGQLQVERERKGSAKPYEAVGPRRVKPIRQPKVEVHDVGSTKPN